MITDYLDIRPENVLKVNANNFENIALQVFRFQYARNKVYREYVNALGTDVSNVASLTQIPFLPVSFFKSHQVVCDGITQAGLVFESSGTTGAETSKHYVASAALYEQSLINGFQEAYGNVQNFVFLALLPSYLERSNASLVHMAKTLMLKSTRPENDFFLNDWERLSQTITSLEGRGQHVILLGVTFALLDFAAAFPMALQHTIVMETGGMKGRREELTRQEVHALLASQWRLQSIHSEYGMTELLSQAYAKKDGVFTPASTMKVMARDINDPLDTWASGSGCLNIIDLANLYSCSFVATEDLGRVYQNGDFEVYGRLDHSALRGCSLMFV